jgi:hypothetical protein
MIDGASRTTGCTGIVSTDPDDAGIPSGATGRMLLAIAVAALSRAGVFKMLGFSLGIAAGVRWFSCSISPV